MMVSGQGAHVAVSCYSAGLCHIAVASPPSYMAVRDCVHLFFIELILAVLLQTAPATTGIANMHIATKVNGKA